MAVPTRRILEPVFGTPLLRAANNGTVGWTEVNALSQWQKGTGWQANLYGGAQTGNDDWAAMFIPVNELLVSDFKSALWTYYMTAAQTMGVNLVIWVHDPTDFGKRAEITQLGNISGLGKSQYWNDHVLDITTDQFFWYGESWATGSSSALTGSGISSGVSTLSAWEDYQADVLFNNWTIYRISLEYGWDASGTFDHVWIADFQLNGTVIPIKPSIEERLSRLETNIVLAAGSAAIGKVGHDKTGIGHGVETVDTVGTHQPIVTSSTTAKVVTIQAQTDNTGAIAVGGDAVDATVATGNGVLLYAGDSITLEVDDLVEVYIDATVINEGVRFVYST